MLGEAGEEGKSVRNCDSSCEGPYHCGVQHLANDIQWNPKYGCKGTVSTLFALIALVAWQY